MSTANSLNFLLPEEPNPQWSHMIVVNGRPGSRVDFLCGWLSMTMPEKSQNLQWKIYPGWGRSELISVWNWHVLPINRFNPLEEQRKRIPIIQEQLDMEFSDRVKDSAPIAITKSHIPSRLLARCIPSEYQDRFTFIDLIVTDDDSCRQVEWEGFVKNLLFSSAFRSNTHTKEMLKNYGMQSNDILLDLEKCYDLLKHVMKNISFHVDSKHNIFNVDGYKSFDVVDTKFIDQDYKSLMRPDGCQELIEHFNLSADYAKNLWQTCLPMAKSDDRIWCRGRWWERPNY